jgi:hypothetical protein
MNGRQGGDPAKLAQALLAITDQPPPAPAPDAGQRSIQSFC